MWEGYSSSGLFGVGLPVNVQLWLEHVVVLQTNVLIVRVVE